MYASVKLCTVYIGQTMLTIVLGLPGPITPLCPIPPHVQLHPFPIQLLLHDKLIGRADKFRNRFMR